MLLETIRLQSVEARRAKDSVRATLLVTLFAEAARVGKDAGNRETTDEETQKVVRKFLKGVDESLAVLKDEAARALALAEKSILESFLPQRITGAPLQAVVAEIVASLPDKSAKQMGLVMRSLKERLSGAYDGAEATALVKTALA
jgi:uncharacterized protein YqeY